MSFKYQPEESTDAYKAKQRSLARRDMRSLNKEEDEQAIFEELRSLRGEWLRNIRLHQAQHKISTALLFNTNTGESGALWLLPASAIA